MTLHRALFFGAAILAVLAAFVSKPRPVEVAPLELAQWIKDRKPGLRVIDTRSESAFKEYSIPTAERGPVKAVSGETLVFYSDSGGTLRGGLLGWMNDVMNPVIAGSDTARARISALSRYFGGTPRLRESVDPSLAAALARMKRRGC
jgi:hypothetical protein